MKWSSACVVALLCLGLAGNARAQAAADSYRKAGAAYLKAGQFRESVKAYQQVIRLTPNDADAYEQLGEAYTGLNMDKEAAEAFEKSADLLTSAPGNPVPPAPRPAEPAKQNTTLPAQPRKFIANKQLVHAVGERVEYVEDGKWFKAIITEVRDDSANQLNGQIYAPYRIHSLGFRDLGGHWACCADFTDRRSQLRPAGSGATEPVPGGEANDDVLKSMSGAVAKKPTQAQAKLYTCEVGNPITITGSGTYDGGRYTFDPASATLTFHGGSYDGQRATYEVSFGLAQLHILGPSGRPVIDCN